MKNRCHFVEREHLTKQQEIPQRLPGKTVSGDMPSVLCCTAYYETLQRTQLFQLILLWKQHSLLPHWAEGNLYIPVCQQTCGHTVCATGMLLTPSSPSLSSLASLAACPKVVYPPYSQLVPWLYVILQALCRWTFFSTDAKSPLNSFRNSHFQHGEN